MSKYFLILLFIFVGCYSPDPLSRRGRWEGDVFIVTDGLRLPLHVMFTDVSVHRPDSLITLEGVIDDSTVAEGLGGATVIKRHTSVGCSSGYGGRFRLEALGLHDTLVIGDVGYIAKWIPVGEVVKEGKTSW